MSRARVLVLCIVLVTALAVALPATAGHSVGASVNSPDCSFPVTLTDGTGEDVTIEEPPDEIVVMHASAAQVVHDIGGWDDVTGAPVQPFTAYLDGYDEPTDVTDDVGFPDREAIVNLDPDLVLSGHVGDPDDVEALRGDGLTVYHGPTPTSVEEIKGKVLTYGTLTDRCDGATDRVEWMDERLAVVEGLTEEADDRPLVYYELGEGWTTGEATFQHDMIVRSGGTNLAAEAGLEGWAEISEELVIDLNPDFILYGDSTEEPLVTDAIRSTPAFEQNRTVAVDANLIGQAGPRVVLVMETMAEAFAAGPLEGVGDDISGDGEADTAPVEADAEDEAPNDDTVSTDPGDDDTAEALPGMGVIAGVVALVAAGTAMRRR